MNLSKYFYGPINTCDIIKYYIIVIFLLTLLYVSLDSKYRDKPIVSSMLCTGIFCYLLNNTCQSRPNVVFYFVLLLLACECILLYKNIGCYS
jgi:hypothetical protein